MKLVTGLLAVVLLLAGIGASHAVVRIGEDRGFSGNFMMDRTKRPLVIVGAFTGSLVIGLLLMLWALDRKSVV